MSTEPWVQTLNKLLSNFTKNYQILLYPNYAATSCVAFNKTFNVTYHISVRIIFLTSSELLGRLK